MLSHPRTMKKRLAAERNIPKALMATRSESKLGETRYVIVRKVGPTIERGWSHPLKTEMLPKRPAMEPPKRTTTITTSAPPVDSTMPKMPAMNASMMRSQPPTTLNRKGPSTGRLAFDPAPTALPQWGHTGVPGSMAPPQRGQGSCLPLTIDGQFDTGVNIIVVSATARTSFPSPTTLGVTF